MSRQARKHEKADRTETVLRLAALGLSHPVIAERLGISRMRVNQIVRDRRARLAEDQSPADR